MTTDEQLNAVLIENEELKADNARLSKIIHEAYTPLAKCFHGEWDECNVEHAYLVLKSA